MLTTFFLPGPYANDHHLWNKELLLWQYSTLAFVSQVLVCSSFSVSVFREANLVPINRRVVALFRFALHSR